MDKLTFRLYNFWKIQNMLPYSAHQPKEGEGLYLFHRRKEKNCAPKQYLCRSFFDIAAQAENADGVFNLYI